MDWLVYQLSPSRGARRIAERQMLPLAMSRMADRMSTLGGWTVGSTADEDISRFNLTDLTADAESEEQLETVRKVCVSSYKTDPIGHAAVETRVKNEVGRGVNPRGRVVEDEYIDRMTALAINAGAEESYRLWSEAKVDRKRNLTMPAFQRNVLRNFATTGECFIHMADEPTRMTPLPLVMDLWDSRRVNTPPERSSDTNCRLGIQHNDHGEVVGYWKQRELDYELHPLDLRGGYSETHDYIPRYDSRGYQRVCHIMEPLFPEQTRGWPWLAAAARRMKDVTDFFDAAVLAAQIESCFVGVIKGFTGGFLDEAQQAATTTRAQERLQEIKQGRFEYLQEGEDIQFGAPQRPGGTLAPFCEFSLRGIAACLDLPFELLAKNFLQVTYSSGRLALLDGVKGFLFRRQILVDQWLRDLWKLLFFETVFQTDMLSLVDLELFNTRRYLYERHNWKGEDWESLDPSKEAQANIDSLDHDIKLQSDVISHDYDDFRQARMRERRDAVEDEIELRSLRWQLEESNGLPHQEDEEEDEKELVSASSDKGETK